MPTIDSVGLAPAIVDIHSKRIPVPELRVETVSGYTQFLALKPVWNRLVNAAGIQHPFLEHDWVSAWWDSFGGDSQLHIVLVWAGDELIGIAPLILSRVRWFGIWVKRLGLFS